jgi:uncharacterized 2Fe-2S/4Fe-4S cluster protein (DUF4445 family)
MRGDGMGNDIVRVVFQPMNRWVEVPVGTSLLSALRQAGILIESICGGKGLCRKCRVILTWGSCGTIMQEGGHRISPEDQKLGYYYACQVLVNTDCEFIIPIESRIDSPRILISSTVDLTTFSPVISRYPVEVIPQEKIPAVSCSIRLTGYTGSRPQITESLCEQMTAAQQPLIATLSAFQDPPEIIMVEPTASARPLYGIALDLGTTTIVGALVDLASGTIVETESGLNWQITYEIGRAHV